MGLALDEPGDSDERVEIGGVPFVIAPDVARHLPYGSGVMVDYDTDWERFSVRLAGVAGC